MKSSFRDEILDSLFIFRSFHFYPHSSVIVEALTSLSDKLADHDT